MKTRTITAFIALLIATAGLSTVAAETPQPATGDPQVAAWVEISAAISAGKPRQVKRLIKTPGHAKLRSPDSSQRSLLHVAVASIPEHPAESLKILDLLLAAGADANGTMPSGFSPLHEAARVGSLKAARKLVAKDARLDRRVMASQPLDPHHKYDGSTPTGIAQTSGHAAVAAFLAENSIAWGSPVDGLQLGITTVSDRHGVQAPYIEAHLRNVTDTPRTLLTSIHECLAFGPQAGSLLATELHLAPVGGGAPVTLFFHGANHLNLLDKNRNQRQPELRMLNSTATVELSSEDASARSITLAPGERVDAGPLLHLGSDWLPHSTVNTTSPKGHYHLTAILKIDHPKSLWQGTLKSNPIPTRFPPSKPGPQNR
ncbi:MAG: ankyrin repeat domain-containing protein [Verrucomicrobiales bacterium]|nr:ankyrin repeat domain-containing protein [Verrucomicrobiales bacterium]